MSNSLTDRISVMYLILLVTGFLLVGTIPKLTGITENSLSVQYRVSVVLLSLFLILTTILSKNLVRVRMGRYAFFLIFWFIYSIRIVNDMYFDPITLYPEKTALEYVQFAFGVVLIPSICIILIIQSYVINYNAILKYIYIIIFLILLVSLYFRGNSDLSGRTAGEVNVGILLFGQSGATLSILSIYRLVTNKLGIKSIFYIVGFITGFIGIFVSASKSPFLCLIAVIIIFFTLKYSNIKSIIIIMVGALLLNIYFFDIVSLLNVYFNSNFLDRLLYAVEMGGDRTRELLMQLAFNEFTDSPIFGNAMLIQTGTYTGAYPHNIIVEAFMATGLIGGGIFIMWIIKCLRKSFYIIKRQSERSWISLLFLQYLIFGMFSRNLYSSDLFWFFSILLIGLNVDVKRIKSHLNDNVNLI